MSRASGRRWIGEPIRRGACELSVGPSVSVPGTGGPFGAPAGYDIFMPYGQSNIFFGGFYDGSIDLTDPSIFQFGYNAPHANAIFAAQEPLDFRDDGNHVGGVNNTPPGNYIGHDMHFLRDYYKPNAAGGRRMLLCGNSYGGQGIDKLVPSTINGGTDGFLWTDFITRAPLALAAAGAGSQYKAVLFHQGEGDYQINWVPPFVPPNPTALQIQNRQDIRRAYLAALIDLVRSSSGLSVPNLPWVQGQVTVWSVDAGGANFGTEGVIQDKVNQELVNRVPYTGFAVNNGMGTSNVHYTAAEQRLFAAQYWIAYQAALLNTRSAVTWPAIDVPVSDFVVSNSNLDITGGAASNWKSAIANGGRIGEKFYAEMEAVAVASQTNMMAGITAPFLDSSTYMGNSGAIFGARTKGAAVWGGQPNSVTGWTVANAVSIGTITAGTRIKFAVDQTTGKAWVGKTGAAWPNSGDPASGTNPWITGIDAKHRIALAVSIFNGAGNKWRLHTNTGDFSDAVPSGFAPMGT